MDPKKKYCGFVSNEQKKELVLFMEEHPELKSGKFTQDFSFKTAQALWVKLTGRLHSLPGAHKDWKQWRKTWQDLKSKSKKKKTEIRNHQMGTGGGPAVADLNSDDEKILELIGPVLVDGDRNVEESSCHFTVSSLNESTFNVEPITFSPQSNHPTSAGECLTADDKYSSIDHLTSNTSNRKNTSRIQRLNKTIQANDKLIELTKEQNNLLKRDVEAKELIAQSLKALVEYFILKDKLS